MWVWLRRKLLGAEGGIGITITKVCSESEQVTLVTTMSRSDSILKIFEVISKLGASATLRQDDLNRDRIHEADWQRQLEREAQLGAGGGPVLSEEKQKRVYDGIVERGKREIHLDRSRENGDGRVPRG